MIKKKYFLVLFLVYVIFSLSSNIFTEEKNNSITISAGYHTYPDSDWMTARGDFFKRNYNKNINNLPGVSYEIEYLNEIRLYKKIGLQLGVGTHSYEGKISAEKTYENYAPGINSTITYCDKYQMKLSVFSLRTITNLMYNLNKKIKISLGIGMGIYLAKNYIKSEVIGTSPIVTIVRGDGEYYSDNFVYEIAPNYVIGWEYRITDRIGVVLQDSYSDVLIIGNRKVNIGGNSIMLGVKTYF